MFTETYTADNIDSEIYRCSAFETLHGPCESGYQCTAGAGSAECRYIIFVFVTVYFDVYFQL